MIFSNFIGILHLAGAILALIFGTLVLRNTKATRTHKRNGYVYTVAMLIVLTTSFMIYRLHGTFGILHWLAVISSITLLAGILPMLLKKPDNYIGLHYSFMYWSVIGLYCAFCAEILTRIPFLFNLENNIAVVFYAMVGVATALVGGIGSIYFRKYKKRWSAYSESSKK